MIATIFHLVGVFGGAITNIIHNFTATSTPQLSSFYFTLGTMMGSVVMVWFALEAVCILFAFFFTIFFVPRFFMKMNFNSFPSF